MTHPLVSFVIPCLNSEQTIALTLESILNQKTDFSYSIIVIDNESDDKTTKIASKLDNVQIFTETQRGANHARNLGIAKATGEYVAFVDSDVELDRNWLQEIMSYMLNKNLDAAQGLTIRRPMNKYRLLDFYRCYRTENETAWTDMVTPERKVGFINTAACIYRKNTLEQVKGLSKVLKMHEDVDLTYKLMSLPSCAIGCTTSAIAYCFYGGGILQYLKRSFNEGRFRAVLNQKWPIFPKSSSKNNQQLKDLRYYQFKLIECIIMFFTKIGNSYGKLFSNLHESEQFKFERIWSEKIKRIPKSSNYCAYFNEEEIRFNHRFLE